MQKGKQNAFQVEKRSCPRRELRWAGSFAAVGCPLLQWAWVSRCCPTAKCISYVACIKVGCFLCLAVSVTDRCLFSQARGGVNTSFRLAADTGSAEGAWVTFPRDKCWEITQLAWYVQSLWCYRLWWVQSGSCRRGRSFPFLCGEHHTWRSVPLAWLSGSLELEVTSSGNWCPKGHKQAFSVDVWVTLLIF